MNAKSLNSEIKLSLTSTIDKTFNFHLKIIINIKLKSMGENSIDTSL